MKKTIINKQWSLNARNWLKGLIMAVGAPVILKIQQVIDTGSLTFDWKDLGMTAISAALVYLMTKFIEPSKKLTVEKLDDQ